MRASPVAITTTKAIQMGLPTAKVLRVVATVLQLEVQGQTSTLLTWFPKSCVQGAVESPQRSRSASAESEYAALRKPG